MATKASKAIKKGKKLGNVKPLSRLRTLKGPKMLKTVTTLKGFTS